MSKKSHKKNFTGKYASEIIIEKILSLPDGSTVFIYAEGKGTHIVPPGYFKIEEK